MFIVNFPFRKSITLHLNKFESHLPKDALRQCKMKLAKWIWIRRFRQCFSLYYFILTSSWKRAWPFINWRYLFPLPKDNLRWGLDKIFPVVLKKKIWKFQCIFVISLLSFLEKECGILFVLHSKCFVEFDLVVPGEGDDDVRMPIRKA